MLERICRRCVESKKIDQFQKCKRSLGGYIWVCKKCTSKRKKAWKIKNKEIIKEKNRLYRLDNTEKRTEYNKNYHQDHKEQIAIKGKKWQDENKESNHIKAKEYRSKNLHNKRSYNNKYNKERKKVDPQFKMGYILRARLFTALRIQNAEKRESTIELLGCSINDFCKHIESQFLEGMTWDNHGVHTWHIDHIKPCAKFDLTNLDEQKACFHYSNMQPLFALDNILKRDKYEG